MQSALSPDYLPYLRFNQIECTYVYVCMCKQYIQTLMSFSCIIIILPVILSKSNLVQYLGCIAGTV